MVPVNEQPLDRPPRIWKTDSRSPDLETITQAASLLKAGGIVIYPTETFYGLGGVPSLESAVERICMAKGREERKPLPLIASNVGCVLQAVADWPTVAARLAEAFWPGPLTLVLHAVSEIPYRVHGGTGKIAVRVSSHPVARALAEATGGMVISTSANFSGESPVQDADQISPALLSLVDGMLIAGKTGSQWGYLPTTIVDVCSPRPRLVRAGCLPWKAIEAYLV